MRSFSRAFAKQIDAIRANHNRAGKVQFGPDELRQSQDEALEATCGFIKKKFKGGHIIQPGGTGKLHEIVILSEAARRAGGKTLIIVPSQQSVEDTVDRFTTLSPGTPVGQVYQHGKIYGKDVTVITYASLLAGISNGSIKPEDYSLVIGDEGHHYLTDISDDTLAKFTHATKIAFTATPRYYAGKELAGSEHFKQLFYHLTLEEAVARKECTPTKARLIDTRIPIADYDKLFRFKGENAEDSALIERAINNVPWNQTFVDTYKTYTDGETKHRLLGDKAFIFCAGIQHAKDMANQFNDELMPYISNKHGLAFTPQGLDINDTLKAKGIDPGKVKFACAPVWGDMDKTGGWPEEGAKRYTKRQLIDMYTKGEILTLSCDRILAESIDIPQTAMVLNAVPTCSFVRAGQRGMRSSRIHPQKNWAYVFDALPLDWRDSVAAPVLFSEFTVKDPYTANGIEYTAQNGPPRPPQPEQDRPYNIIWDVQDLLSINHMLQHKRSIAKAEIVPQEFLNDSLAVKALKERNETLPPSTPLFISKIYEEWRVAYEAAGCPHEGNITRADHTIPADEFHIANNRLYLHKDALPVLWDERQEFLTPAEMSGLLRKEGHMTLQHAIKSFGEDILHYRAGTYREPYYVKPGHHLYAARGVAINRLKEEHERKTGVMASIPPDALRYYDKTFFISRTLAKAFKSHTYNTPEFVKKHEEEYTRYKTFVGVHVIRDDLIDLGYNTIGNRVLIEHARKAWEAAKKGKAYGGETFEPEDFRFREPKGSAKSGGAPTYAAVKRKSLEKFINVVEAFHDPVPAHEPATFPASAVECFAALRQLSEQTLSYNDFNRFLKQLIVKNTDTKFQARVDKLKEQYGFTGDSIIFRPPASMAKLEDMRITKGAFEGLKVFFAPAPKGLIKLETDPVSTALANGFHPHAVRDFLRNALCDALAENEGTSKPIYVAGLSIPPANIWRRDVSQASLEKSIVGNALYIRPVEFPKIALLYKAIAQCNAAIDKKLETLPEHDQPGRVFNISIEGVALTCKRNQDGKVHIYCVDKKSRLALAEHYIHEYSRNDPDTSLPDGGTWMNRVPRAARARPKDDLSAGASR